MLPSSTRAAFPGMDVQFQPLCPQKWGELTHGARCGERLWLLRRAGSLCWERRVVGQQSKGWRSRNLLSDQGWRKAKKTVGV